MKYIILRNFVSGALCNEILYRAKQEIGFKHPLNLKDSDDVANTVYKSKRSKGLSYNYITSIDDSEVVGKLKNATGLDFRNSINKYCLPVFMYKKGDGVKAHKGVQKENNNSEYQEYIAVCILEAHENQYKGEGVFYINPKAEASLDGKTVTNDNHEDRIYIPTKRGDVIIFHNPSLVHGVTPIKSGSRATCSWRTNSKQI